MRALSGSSMFAMRHGGGTPDLGCGRIRRQSLDLGEVVVVGSGERGPRKEDRLERWWRRHQIRMRRLSMAGSGCRRTSCLISASRQRFRRAAWRSRYDVWLEARCTTRGTMCGSMNALTEVCCVRDSGPVMSRRCSGSHSDSRTPAMATTVRIKSG